MRFVWLATQSGATGQKWPDDKPHVFGGATPIAQHWLKADEEAKTIDELAQLYPAPKIERNADERFRI